MCCSDGLHCCPHGTTCDVESGTCNRVGNVWRSLSIFSKSHYNCRDEGNWCPSNWTCCELFDGGIGCCSITNGICCSGGRYCVDHSSKCETKLPSLPDLSLNVVKCDKVSSCPDGYTCCKLSSGGYACCPYKDAVCCSDGLHCCPHGTTCRVEQGTCIRQTDSTGISAIWSKLGKTMVKCLDGSSCAGKETCCELSSGGYGCCPYEEAVCCSDGLHCCPHGTTCDVKQGTCIRQTDSTGISAIWSKVGKTMVKCHDGSSCAGKETCCELSSGGYGCCPYEEAVCCSDGLHCCPHGTTCDVKQGTCIRQTDSTGISAIWSKVGKTMVKCLDGSSCAGKETCCELSSGGYGCCPYEEAVCCSDGLHCCPHGTTCDVESGTCNRVGNVWRSLSIFSKSHYNCRDEGNWCPSNWTCCELFDGGIGCCSITNGICCSGGRYCVDHSSKCETKLPSLPDLSLNVVKCDKVSSCPDGYTCCKLSSGGYACCPYKDAVCCSDGLHCCPHGTTCRVEQGTCIRQTDSTGISAIWSKLGKTMVKCLDGSSCAGKETCCELSSGGYGCCPYEEAVCCSDGLHCCPHGTTCNLAAGMCSSNILSFSHISPPLTTVGDVICPDGISSCPSGYTCCKLKSGDYGCCPFADAVCCSDGLHCCPKGTTCDLSTETCISERYHVKMRRKLSSFRFSRMNFLLGQRNVIESSPKAVICPGGKTECKDGSTCCLIGDHTYGCCPMKSAVCCSDMQHCCPNGFRCGPFGRFHLLFLAK